MGKTILLADDDSAFRESVKMILELEDYFVIEAANGTDAIAEMSNQRVDLLISDILMPQMQGDELCVKSKVLWPDLKVIAMTGGGSIGSELSHTAFDAVLNKPFRRAQLLQKVESLLNHS